MGGNQKHLMFIDLYKSDLKNLKLFNISIKSYCMATSASKGTKYHSVVVISACVVENT